MQKEIEIIEEIQTIDKIDVITIDWNIKLMRKTKAKLRNSII